MSKILFLNGTSSSGKTTIAKLLHEELRYPEWIYISADTFLHMMPDHAYKRKDFLTTWFPIFLTTFHRTVAAFAQSGIPVILDHVLEREGWLEDYQKATEGIRTVYIEVFCPLSVLEERERKRGDRVNGQARSQFNQVHKNVPYDLSVDTSRKDPATCVQEIMGFLQKIE
jgi:chloramphenicol 3-O phosphotransferase